MDVSGLSQATGSADSATVSSQANIDPKLWLQKHEVEGESPYEFLDMFYIDAIEMNGVIYLFGKVLLNNPNAKEKMYVSTCVQVHGNERNLFVLPRGTGQHNLDGTEVRAEMQHVFGDLKKLLQPGVIPARVEGQAFKVKPVKRKYAFECPNIPREETQYLKVKYSAKYGAPTSRQCTDGTTHIERVFGASSSPLEYFLLKRKLMGPSWIRIKNPRPINSV